MSTSEIIWSNTTQIKIREIKKAILKKKLMLSFIIDSYAWWDRTYRWGHISIAVLSPIFNLITVAADSSGSLKILTIIISALVAGMVKFKDYIKFGELRDMAKQQTIKYSQLYERIERELIKPNNKKQSEDEFIYWINREYSQIELLDPELNYSDKKKFIKLCKMKNIPIDEDLETLQSLLQQSDNSYITKHSNPISEQHQTSDNLVEINRPNSPDIFASPSTKKKAKQHFHKTLKKINTKAELEWAISRLNAIDQV